MWSMQDLIQERYRFALLDGRQCQIRNLSRLCVNSHTAVKFFARRGGVEHDSPRDIQAIDDSSPP